MSFLIKNVSGSTIVLSDLKVLLDPVGSNSYVDLDMVASRDEINRSLDLLRALRSKKVIPYDTKKQQPVEPKPKSVPIKKGNDEELNKKLDTILNAINNIVVNSGKVDVESVIEQTGKQSVDAEKIADIMSKVAEVTDIHLQNKPQQKTVKLKTNVKEISEKLN